ncbi:hypothetical protein HK102_010313 [Quaeritorhiza haematococci]|nr:hypothetical protein HK102_010313 [Quaeritorhiza haematococci]
MYRKIQSHPNPLELYISQQISQNFLTSDYADKVSTAYQDSLEKAYQEASKVDLREPQEWLQTGEWATMLKPSKLAKRQETGVSRDELLTVGHIITGIPLHFHAHKKIQQIYADRRKAIESGVGIDWATAEAMAFGTLAYEGYTVRLSGQDTERGTFSQRHSVIYDQETEEKYCPLAEIKRRENGTSFFQVANSSLSEFGVLGFEHGYALENPNALVCWEAQFADFANGAQVIIDQFISSSEEKWLRQSGVTLLLPHGYEGQGPEHSSGRIERFLQLCNEPEDFPVFDHLPRGESSHPYSPILMKQTQSANWVVANPSTPSNFFHLLRRQVHRMFRKPLVLFTPKSLLKASYCVSDLSSFVEGQRFMNIITDTSPNLLPDPQINRVIFCSGKVFYDLDRVRQKNNIQNTHIIRVEQISPFPFHMLRDQVQRWSQNVNWVWCQEEPKNMGAWTYVRPRFEAVLEEAGVEATLIYAGRRSSAASATGSKRHHYEELEELLQEAFDATNSPNWKRLDLA